MSEIIKVFNSSINFTGFMPIKEALANIYNNLGR